MYDPVAHSMDLKLDKLARRVFFFFPWTHLQRMVEKNWVIPDQTVKFLKILAKKQVKNQCNKCVTEGIFVWNEHYLHRNRVKKVIPFLWIQKDKDITKKIIPKPKTVHFYVQEMQPNLVEKFDFLRVFFSFFIMMYIWYVKCKWNHVFLPQDLNYDLMVGLEKVAGFLKNLR